VSVKHSDITYHQDCQIVFKASAHIWVHADGVNALSHIFGVLGFLFSLNEFPVMPRLGEV